MKVKDLIKMLKGNGIKGNSKVLIDCIDDTTINGCVVIEEQGKEVVVLTDNINVIVEERQEDDIKVVKQVNFYEEMRKKK